MDDAEPWVAIADRVARVAAHRFHVELDDAKQTARLAAWKAWGEWRPGQMTRERFAGVKAFYGVVDMLRNQGGYGSEVGRLAYAAGKRFDALPLRPDTYVGFTRSHAPMVEAACDVAMALRMIPAREALIVSLVDLDGLTQGEAAAMIGVTSTRVWQIRARAFSLMRPLLAA